MRLVAAVVGLALMVLLAGCAVPARRPIVFEPEGDENTISYYVVGEPYSTSSTSCGDVTLHLSVFSIAGSGYMGAFVHYSYLGGESFLLEPLEDFTLRIVEETGEEVVVSPRSPSDLERAIRASKNAALFAQALFAGISAAAVRPTTVAGPNGTYVIDDTAIKQAVIANETVDVMAATQATADILTEVVHSNVLKKHTLFPGGDIAGLVYFPAKFAATSAYRTTRTNKRELSERRFELSFETPCGTETVVFVPVEGE